MRRKMRRLTRSLAQALHLPETAARIVDLLARTSRELTVREIVQRVRMSERSVRTNLALLVRRGLLERQIVETAQRRLAYLYRLRPREELLEAVRVYLARNLRLLQEAAGLSSPRSASSSRS